MDLAIAGKTALVTASSKGLGRGCAMALAEAGVHLVLNARGAEALEATAAEIRAAHGVRGITVAGDITQDAVRAAVLDAAVGADILVTNAGGPPPDDSESGPTPASGRRLRPVPRGTALGATSQPFSQGAPSPTSAGCGQRVKVTLPPTPCTR